MLPALPGHRIHQDTLSKGKDMAEYKLLVGYEDRGSAFDEVSFDDEATAREAFEDEDIARRWRTEWECLPTGGRERLKPRRAMKELCAVEDGEPVGDPIACETYGYEEFSAE